MDCVYEDTVMRCCKYARKQSIPMVKPDGSHLRESDMPW